MAIDYLATSYAVVDSSVTAANSSGAYDSLATGTDRMLCVAFFYENDTVPQNITACTYNGSSLARPTNGKATRAGQFSESAEIWTLKNPATGSNTLAWTKADSGQDFVVVAWVMTGCDETVGNSIAEVGTDQTADLVFANDESAAIWAAVDNRADQAPWTPATDNVEIAEGVIATGASGFTYSVGWRGPEAMAGTYSVGSDTGAFDTGAMVALELKIAAGGGGATPNSIYYHANC
ncbi:MAG TPA: hypothetical protein VLA12_05265 [Planctomycetaceae bacterium]|nr:hypothetical protein [Planctomycetaceae bacterium]